MKAHRPAKFRSLASKFTLFTSVVVGWVAVTILGLDLRRDQFDVSRGLWLAIIVLLVAGAISRFTMRLLARPLALLEEGITAVRMGRLEPVQISRTGDEIEFLGESFNKMIETLAASKEEIRQHNELLEQRIRQRTEELEAALGHAVAASQAKSEFLTNMSHELRTPMAGLLGMLDVVMESRLTADQKDQIETARRCGNTLLALLNDLLDLSKIEAGRMMLERIVFDVRNELEESVKSHQAAATMKGISLGIEIDDSAPRWILGDPLRLRQIVANLVSNAVKFTSRGGIRVRLSSAGADRMEIAISDTGAGIPAEKISAIFDKFTQADGSISRRFGGTGLGLAITRKLVEIHGGRIRVESKLDAGSTFTVELPVERAQEFQATEGRSKGLERSPDPAPRDRAERRLLVVEDNHVNQKVVTAILRKRGYVIEVAADGREALERLDREKFDLVLMDVQMPVLDGLEATRAIRRDDRWAKLPIVAMTAHAMNGDRERCLQAGMNGYISKPVQPAHLVAMVERYLVEGTRDTAPSKANRIDQSVTDRMIEGESQLVSSMLHLFLQLAPERLARLRTAAEVGDVLTLAREAKSVAGAARTLASPKLRHCAERIEAAASRGNFGEVKLTLGELQEEIEGLQTMASA